MAPQKEPIIKRHVSRWFWDGKGYATETAAIRAKARERIRDEVLGSTRCNAYRRAKELEVEGQEMEGSCYRAACLNLYRERFQTKKEYSLYIEKTMNDIRVEQETQKL